MSRTIKEYFAERYEDSGCVTYCVCQKYFEGGYDVISTEYADLESAMNKANELNNGLIKW